MTVNTLGPQKAIDMIEEGDIVNGNRKFNVTSVTSAGPRILTTCSTPDRPKFLSIRYGIDIKRQQESTTYT
jgi:hypothetical protein